MFKKLKYYLGVTKHKLWVLWYSLIFIKKIFWRAITHDLSKYSLKESEHLYLLYDKFKTLEFGSDEYKKYLKIGNKSIDIHYKKNSHHIEHFSSYQDMSIYDIIEMCVDWHASTHKNTNGHFLKSLEHNKKRYLLDKNIVKLIRSYYEN